MFLQEVNTLADLSALLPEFQSWYNEQLLQSSLEDLTPAAVLADDVAAIFSYPTVYRSGLGRGKSSVRGSAVGLKTASVRRFSNTVRRE